MENAPVVYAVTFNIPPEIEERYNKWATEVYLPLLTKTSLVSEIDRYRIIKPNPEIADNLTLYYFDNLEAYKSMIASQVRQDIYKDVATTFSQRKIVWARPYWLLRSFKNYSSASKSKNVPTETAAVVHIEALELSPQEKLRYDEWFTKYAYRIYIPVIMRLPGLRSYSRYLDTGEGPEAVTPSRPQESKYPVYLNILYFENLKAFEEYESSPELASFKRDMKHEVSDSLVTKWYFQYELIKSWRK
jgi:hypothetical protein